MAAVYGRPLSLMQSRVLPVVMKGGVANTGTDTIGGGGGGSVEINGVDMQRFKTQFEDTKGQYDGNEGHNGFKQMCTKSVCLL